jgi:hypothetical protein
MSGRDGNGTKRWLIYVSTAILLTFSGWLGSSVVALGTRVSVAETKSDDVARRLDQIEGKIDELLRR